MPKISGSARNKLVLAALIVVFIAGWVFLDVPPLSTLRTWADTLGPWFPVAFWLLYILSLIHI